MMGASGSLYLRAVTATGPVGIYFWGMFFLWLEFLVSQPGLSYFLSPCTKANSMPTPGRVSETVVL